MKNIHHIFSLLDKGRQILIKDIYHIFSLLDKGRQILMKDNLIDEEKAKQEEEDHESMQQRIDRSTPPPYSISNQSSFSFYLCPVSPS